MRDLGRARAEDIRRARHMRRETLDSVLAEEPPATLARPSHGAGQAGFEAGKCLSLLVGRSARWRIRLRMLLLLLLLLWLLLKKEEATEVPEAGVVASHRLDQRASDPAR